MFCAWVHLKLITRHYGGGVQHVMLRQDTKAKMSSNFCPLSRCLFSIINHGFLSVFGLFLYANDFDFLLRLLCSH